VTEAVYTHLMKPVLNDAADVIDARLLLSGPYWI
jgi:hypothetical protein